MASTAGDSMELAEDERTGESRARARSPTARPARLSFAQTSVSTRAALVAK